MTARYQLSAEQTTSRYSEAGSSDEYKELRFIDSDTGETVTVRVYALFGHVDPAFDWVCSALSRSVQ